MSFAGLYDYIARLYDDIEEVYEGIARLYDGIEMFDDSIELCYEKIVRPTLMDTITSHIIILRKFAPLKKVLKKVYSYERDYICDTKCA